MSITTWNRETVLGLAPDEASSRAGQALTSESKWSNLGSSDAALWGECKGSGSKPYQTRIALEGPAFKCTCPSRKFPCKHGIGLFLMFADKSHLFPVTEMPGWVSEWLESRNDREQKKTERAQTKADKPVDEAARAKTAAKRLDRVDEGIEQLERWLHDMARSGFAAVARQPYSYWDGMAQRLVDAQAPGLARVVRGLGSTASSGAGWPDRLLAGCGKLQLLIDAYRNRESLSLSLREEVKSRVGFLTSKEEVLTTGERVTDTWVTLGQSTSTDNDGIRIQKTWLQGKASGRWVLLLAFSHRAQPMEGANPNFVTQDGTVAFYPGQDSMRGIVVEGVGASLSNFPIPTSLAEQLWQFRCTAAANPWLEEYPLLVRGTVVAGSPWMLVDDAKLALPISASDAALWQLAAYAGGLPLTIFGLWNGEVFTPYSADGHGNMIDVAPGNTA